MNPQKAVIAVATEASTPRCSVNQPAGTTPLTPYPDQVVNRHEKCERRKGELNVDMVESNGQGYSFKRASRGEVLTNAGIGWGQYGDRMGPRIGGRNHQRERKRQQWRQSTAAYNKGVARVCPVCVSRTTP